MASYQDELFMRDFNKEKEEGMERVRAKAERVDATFHDRAYRFVIEYLTKVNRESGEVITSAAKDAGIVPHDDRAFGPVFNSLLRRGIIVAVGSTKRRKGHGAPGAQIWRLV